MSRPARKRPERAVRPAVRRAAIYVRVSTDEQAALEFNSLQAQEQICRTYVTMRDSDPASPERWTYSETYSDPGYSGGTLERPALKRLMDDVAAGRVDTILVYKIDRLSRSIHQFYRIWEVMERYRVDLVSATQDLNTSTSQGKLMLNMLLSFGQFEREQISERTRDKIAAARRRGLMTGGMPVLGYDVAGGRLTVNEEEARWVREIFAIYVKERSLTAVVRETESRGMRMKSWTTKGGTLRGGGSFDKVGLYNILRRPLYAGKVPHRGSLFEGQHEAIVDEVTWNQVQALLQSNGVAGYQGERSDSHALLKGILNCAQCGCRMTPTYTSKGTRRHRYYVCQTRLKKGAHACPTGRVAAHDVEQQVAEQMRSIGRDPALITEIVRQSMAQRDELVAQLAVEGKALRRELQGKRASLKRLVAKSGETANLQAIQQRIVAMEARLTALPGEIEAAKRAAITQQGVRTALEGFGIVWESLWPKERTLVIGLLVEGVDYDGREKRIATRLRTVRCEAIGSIPALT